MSQQKPEAGKGQPEQEKPEADAGEDVSTLQGELARLRTALQEQEEEAAKNYDSLLRERAELENFKKRMQRDRQESLRFATEPLIRSLLPVVDNLERALEHGDDGTNAMMEGVRLVLGSLVEVLEQHGVQRIDARGQQFDPAFHEAMAQVDSPDHDPNQVVEQHSVGYRLHDRLLRPALVTVNARKMENTVAPDQNSD